MVHMEKVNKLFVMSKQPLLLALSPPFLNITELENYGNRKYIGSSNTANLSEQAFPPASVTFDSPSLYCGIFQWRLTGVRHFLRAQPKSFPTKTFMTNVSENTFWETTHQFRFLVAVY